MLTSIYYYNHYKPYLYSTDKSPKSKKIGKTSGENISRFSGIETKDYLHSNPKDSAYFLNYSDNKEVKSVISGISDNVNGIKDTVHYLQNAKHSKNARFDGGKSAYGDGLEDLADDLNSLSSFAEGKSISGDIKEFDRNVSKIAEENGDLLEEFGITKENGEVKFDRSVYDAMSQEDFEEKSTALNKAFSQIYDDAVGVLQKPLSQHLNFKNLDYFYNYSYATKSKEPLGFIESGLVVDITL